MAALILWGSEISIDLKSMEGVQSEASVIAFADGSFLAVWTDSHVGGDIVGQFFAADGAHKGEAFLVTSSPGGQQGAPQAALLNDGRYVVAWSNPGGTGDADDVGVWARIFDQQGRGSDACMSAMSAFLGSRSFPSLLWRMALRYPMPMPRLSSTLCTPMLMCSMRVELA